MAAIDRTFDYANGTNASEVIDFFESSFADKHVLPDSLVQMWLKRAVARYIIDVEELIYDDKLKQFNKKLDITDIEILCLFMKKFYQERELSKANKRVSIVGKDLSVNSGMSSSKYLESELDKINEDIAKMIYNKIPTAYK